jgi:hypothetical protein
LVQHLSPSVHLHLNALNPMLDLGQADRCHVLIFWPLSECRREGILAFEIPNWMDVHSQTTANPKCPSKLVIGPDRQRSPMMCIRHASSPTIQNLCPIAPVTRKSAK